MRDLPQGTVTFLFTDIEGSTLLLKRLGERYAAVLAEHQRLLRDAFAESGGQEIDTQGDSFFIAFPRAKDAVAAAIAGQKALAQHAWPKGGKVRVRMGLHSGEPTAGDERYVGMGVHKGARIASAAHGGQILVSNATRELIADELPPRVRLVDLGEQPLKDFDRMERIFQLDAPGLGHRFPPLRTDAPLPAARSWQRRPRVSRERALVVAAAAVFLAAVVAGLAIAMAGHEKSAGKDALSASGQTSERHTSSGQDPQTIVPGSSIGAVALGMTDAEVQSRYGSGSESQWRSRGQVGTKRTYPGPGGALIVSFYNERAVQVGTTSSYYRTDDGIAVGTVAPYPAWGDPDADKAALRRGEIEQLEPGVYAWRDFVYEGHSRSYCLRDNRSATQLVLAPVLKPRLIAVYITDGDFLAELPAHQAHPPLGTNDVYCTSELLKR